MKCINIVLIDVDAALEYTSVLRSRFWIIYIKITFYPEFHSIKILNGGLGEHAPQPIASLSPIDRKLARRRSTRWCLLGKVGKVSEERRSKWNISHHSPARYGMWSETLICEEIAASAKYRHLQHSSPCFSRSREEGSNYHLSFSRSSEGGRMICRFSII